MKILLTGAAIVLLTLMNTGCTCGQNPNSDACQEMYLLDSQNQ